MTPPLELEIEPWIISTRSVCARRRVSVTDSLGSPRSSTVTSSSGTPPMPPAALISSRAISAPISPCWPQSTKMPACGMMTPSRTLSPASFAPTAGVTTLAVSSTTSAIPIQPRRIRTMIPPGLWVGSRQGQRELIELGAVHLASHAPALDRRHDLRQLLGGIRRKDEALPDTPALDAPRAIGELRRDALGPQRQVAREIPIELPVRARQRREVAAQHVAVARLVYPPERVELAAEDHAQAELLGHVDLRIEQARRLDLTLQQRIEPATEAADRLDPDLGERQIAFESVGHVVVAARHQADGDRHTGQILRPTNARVRPHVDRVARNTVGVGHELAHAGPRVAHAAPRARVADSLRAFQKWLILRPRLVASGPALHLAEVDVPHHLGIESFVAKKSRLERDPLMQAHSGGEDADFRWTVHRLGDGNTTDRGVSNPGDIIAPNVRPAARQRADARRRLCPGRDRLHAHLRRAEPAPPGPWRGLHGRCVRGTGIGPRRLLALGDPGGRDARGGHAGHPGRARRVSARAQPRQPRDAAHHDDRGRA